MLDEHVEFLERALVQQQLDALAGGQLAAGVLRLDALVAAALFGACATFIECFEDMLHGFRPRILMVSGGRRLGWAAF